MTYPLAFDSWGTDECMAIKRVLNRGRYTMGDEVAAFEHEFAKFVGIEHAVMVNSGSSANLLAVASMVLDGRLSPGDEVIVPAVSWSTTYFPLHQYGLVLRFVDVDPATLNLGVELVEDAINERTGAVFAVNLLGNPCDFAALSAICDGANIPLMVDNCESLGATYAGKEAGTFGAVGTYSFFFSHHLQTMEGGMIVTSDRRIADHARSLRAHGWVRDLPADSSVYRTTGDWFEEAFKFVLPGYSVRPLEMSGAVGREQLKKLSSQISIRRRNAEVYRECFGSVDWAEPYVETTDGESSWFGFPIVLRGALDGQRKRIVNHLRDRAIETRPIVAGNFLRHPVAARLNIANLDDSFPVADAIHDNGFFMGNSARDLTENLWRVRHLIEAIR